MKEKILITGITGFVGSHLADYVLSLGDKYEVYGTKRWHLSRLDNITHILEKITLMECNLTDPISVRDMIAEVKPDRIFHMAAESFVSPSWKHPNLYMDINYKATVNLLDALHYFKMSTVFHIPGSGEEYGNVDESHIPITEETIMHPVNPYAVTKIAQDLIGYVYYQSYGINVIRTRAFNHEGPRRDKVFGIPWYAYQVSMVEAGLQEPLLKVGHLDDRRNFTHVYDMVEAYWISTEKCKPGELYLIGSDEESQIFTFRQALEKLIERSTVKGITYEIVPEYVRPTQVPRLIADTTKFREATGWKPKISFEKILDDTLEYWQRHVARRQTL
jgi:GDP-4-dehydro-6-deoxy-D-mannose reductase